MAGYFAYVILIAFPILFAAAIWVFSLGILIGQYRRRRVLSFKHIHLLLIPLTTLTFYFCFEVFRSSHAVLGGEAVAAGKCLALFVAVLILPYAGLLLYRRYQTAQPQKFESTDSVPLFHQRDGVRYAMAATAIGLVLTTLVFIAESGPSRLLVHAAKTDNIQLVKLLTCVGPDVNVKDRLGHSPLWFACRNGNLEMVSLFLSNGADLEFSRQQSLLDIASYHGRTEIVRLLLDRGIDVNLKDSYGQTPLIAASRGGTLDVAKLLVERGADVNATTTHGATALIYACDRSDISVAKFLLENGANPEVKATYGDGPMLHAVRRRNDELARLLKSYGAKDL